MIVATASYEASEPTVDTQIIALAASGADTLLIAAGPKFAALAIRKAYDIGWRPTRFLAQVSAARPRYSRAVGRTRPTGVITASRSSRSPIRNGQTIPIYWRGLSSCTPTIPRVTSATHSTFLGYSNAVLFAEVLRRCGDNLTRENLMAVAAHLHGVRMPALLPGITLNTSPTENAPPARIKQKTAAAFSSLTTPTRWVAAVTKREVEE